MKLRRLSFLCPLAFAVFSLAAMAQVPVPPIRRPPPAPATPAAKTQMSINPQTAIARANGYLNDNDTFTANFTQFNPDGSRDEGRLFVQRPGRMRFEFTKPPTLQIIADGTSVSIHDRKLHTQDNYFIGQTPLKFLLKEDIDLAKDTKVTQVSPEGNTTAIYIEDDATMSGTSKIKLVFDNSNFALKQWQVTDPQGYETLVSLSNIDTSAKIDPAMFKIELEGFSGNR